MRKLMYVLIGFVAIAGMAFVSMNRAEEIQAPPEETQLVVQEEVQSKEPHFADFKVPQFSQFREDEPAAVSFKDDSPFLEFEEVLQVGAESGPNFAGKYTIITTPCGGSCQRSFILHAETGEILVSDLVSQFDLSYTPESTLLIVNPRENIRQVFGLEEALQKTIAADYYLFEGERLQLLFKQQPDGTTVEGCPEIPVRAKNSVTDHINEFASRCDVPSGWIETAETPLPIEKVEEEVESDNTSL